MDALFLVVAKLYRPLEVAVLERTDRALNASFDTQLQEVNDVVFFFIGDPIRHRN